MRVVKEMPSTEEANVAKINAALKSLTQGIENVDIKITCQVGAGDQYKTITNVEDVNKPGEPVDLVHQAGEVWLVDFWATWCPPCQGPMAHNQDMLTKHAEAWGGKVRIIGLSIDGAPETVVKKVEEKGWNKIEHYWRSKSDCSTVYGVKGVPHVLLVDTTGKIVYKGHPASRPDLVADFNLLLKGEKLDCDPTPSTGADAARCRETPKAKIPNGMTSIDSVQINREMNEFKVVAEQMQKDIGENAKGLAKDFCVSVL